MNMAYFPFSERRDTFAFTCTHILDGEGEIRLVTHHFDDGSYEFLCGEEGHEAAHAVIITIGELLDLDPPSGWSATCQWAAAPSVRTKAAPGSFPSWPTSSGTRPARDVCPNSCGLKSLHR